MPFRFEWKDATKRAICYIAEGDWNWKDYHHAARASLFTLTGVEHPVDSVIDLRASTRMGCRPAPQRMCAASGGRRRCA